MPRAPRFMPLLLLLLSLPHTRAAFPQDPLPLLTSDLQGTSPLSWFRGLEDDAVVAELGLDFQRFLTLNRTLLVAARDHVFSFDLQAQEAGEGLVPNKYLTWRSQDMENCAVRGKLTDECHNYIRVLVPWDSQTLLACGTNSFSPVCRSYGITSLQQEGEELSGQARCPFDATQSNVAIFAEGSLYSATAADFQASDAVVYRSLGPQPPLRSAKYDSKWLREPHFVHALEHGDHVYFFFREVSVEDARLGRVQFSRVARVCKRDMGGSPRALDRHWTSFLKLRLNCSVPGDSTFYFDVLQALTGPVNLYGRSALFGVFTTQTNSIPGSAVCAFYLDDIEHAFEGKFKEQRSLDGAWTPVSEDRVPSPRPGSCAGVGVAALFPSSRDLPDDVLTFIKAHPLLDPAVPPATHQPLLTLTSRALLTQLAVDGRAGPYGNTTVLFLGSEDGTVLKVLPPGGPSGGPEPILLEEINAYSPARCSGKRAAQTARRVIGLELDTEGHRLFVAFSGCIIYLPLSRCARHGACQRSCLASQDPYCGWHSSRGCVDIRGPGGTDVDPAGNQESTEHSDCQDGATGSQSGTGDSAYVLLGPGPSPETPSPLSDAHPRPQSSTIGAHTQGVRRDLPPASASLSVPIPLLLACAAAAFALGASVSGLLVSCACRRAHRRRSKDVETPGLPRPLSLRSLARLHGAGPEPPQSKDGDGAQPPQLYTTFLPPPEGVAPPELACLPTPESTPELPAKHLRHAGGPWEWNQNGNNAKEGQGRARGGNAAGGPAPRVLVRPPPPGCPGQAVEVTTLEELLRYLHGPQPPRKGAEPLAAAAFTSRALPPEPSPTPTLFAGPSLLPRECGPPLRLDVPPEGKCAAPSTRPALSAPAPRLGVGGGRRTPFPTHRAPPALLTRVPSGGPSRYCGGPGRHLLYLGRPEGYRGRALKRVDVEKPQLPPKPPLVAPSPPPAVPNGSHFHF
ncbi:semaphorin-6C isoform X1 [Panthera onca]|uniref:semaphorin-6C isoform X1 n=2 Tax=Panthera TaxID=9688 RepID=UPI001C6FAFD8|nr:semaphorin-6C isoform X1 [Panthera tigris]XP_042850012.1 semaphorin-6C isoform X1 [Panthera tigris]XP_042850013.1 semaphorin-6C isoform X1 [Panthera tigris]XP_042850014.1 semaphorin-6C isoform X1 [Panthera tigris]XP_042850015.1 semaphorin-6C isoform X1 [Panthera tigris]XP_060478630.1 semaphorin-6C isoform X1 [Panthera onca]XP_060478631.1 semaphorin-6C isoform X1 [Panthera onca]XP_060478632.1 semaphorin-6C isoform X1 [Panthera onca]XP_060478633.1 semaphorin-6C isoform X1 [Panthera onca]